MAIKTLIFILTSLIVFTNAEISGTIQKDDGIKAIPEQEVSSEIIFEEKEGETTTLEPTTPPTHKETDLICIDEVWKREAEGEIIESDLDICKTVSLQCLHDILQKVIEDPAKLVSGKDFACILINLLQRNTEFSSKITTLESSLNQTLQKVDSLTTQVSTQSSTLQDLDKSTSNSSLKTSQDLQNLQEQLNSFSESQLSSKKEQNLLKNQVESNRKDLKSFSLFFNSTIATAEQQSSAFESSLKELDTIGQAWSTIQNNIQQLTTHSSKTELEIVQKFQQISTDVSNLYTQLSAEVSRSFEKETEIAGNLLKNISSLEVNLQKEMYGHLEDIKNSTISSLSSLEEDLKDHKKHIDNELDSATKDMKTMLETPFKMIEDLDASLSLKIKEETERAKKSEEALALQEIAHNSGQILAKENLQQEIARALKEERYLQEVVSEQGKRLSVLHEDFKSEIKVESLRAKGAEAELSIIVQKQAEKLGKSEKEIKQTLENYKEKFSQEVERNLKMEQEIQKKIQEGSERLSESEAGLLKNINSELKRASETEEKLDALNSQNNVKIQEIQEELLKLKDEFEQESGNKMEVINITTHLILEQSKKFLQIEEQFKTSLKLEKEDRIKTCGVIKQDLNSLLEKHTEKDEHLSKNLLDVENALKYNLNVTGFLTQAGKEFEEESTNNFTLFGNKLESLRGFMEDTLKLVVTQVSYVEKNFTENLLTVAEHVDKLSAANDTLTQRVEVVEGDLKKLINPPKVTPNGGGVFDRLYSSFFGGRRPSNGTRVTGQKGKEGVKGRSGDFEEYSEEDIQSLLSSRLRVDNVFEEDEGEAHKNRENQERAFPIYVKRSNSKVTNTYG